MDLIIVDNETKARQFLDVHVQLNKDVPGWIRPLDKDINTVFDPKLNKAFRFGECIRWILIDSNGQLIGRLAAFVNKKYRSKGDTCKVGGVGFFDCINDQAAANLLFDTAKKWLEERGMGAMDGPINFGERNNWWGLLTEGFHEPLYGMSFNPPYYKQLMENYGFKVFFNQICYGMKVHDELRAKFFSRHAAVEKDPGFRSEHIRKGELQRYAREFSLVYNKAWAKHAGGKDMSEQQAYGLFKQMKPLLDERLCWFIYYNDEPIGIWLNLPDLNQYLKKFNGKFGLWQKLQFLWMKIRGTNKKFVGIIFGIVPEFQAMGVDAYLIVEGAKIIQHHTPYVDYEMQWVGDFNPKMINVAESLGATPTRTLTTYRYLFDRNAPFERHPILT
ncbi:hypothetical protein SAMN05444266_101577 [Chitinophaga jiangningensis]|uniref:N-acetyltransferase domain-containing protein n=1 Tax=Chitinophaga jiangningensis TaxID=1419482 RepID=A0A1M6WD31_9BACT|nr:hypothetical protein [Chitinophaga jiangningensis]SHK91601.1 hypothetical protein SAMN05444266_101577 [Chitinophaga jiangningensis]